MAGEWEETVLADVSSDVSYGYTESATDEKVGPRFLRITDIQNGVVNWANVPYCPITADNHQKYRLQAGDIVVARTGNSTGENFLYRGDEDAVFASYLIRFRIDCQKADPGFVWYNLRSQDWWNFINNSKTGSAQAGANAKILGLFPLNLPPIPEQRAIAHILGTLDNKIELNRRMNETLEAMARALFKSWFIDFDPVRRNAARSRNQPSPAASRHPLPVGEGQGADGVAGEFPSPPGRRAGDEGSFGGEAFDRLFPDSFEDSELGEIPKGWETGPLDSILVLQRGFDLPATQRTPGVYPVLAASGPSGTHNEHMVRGPCVTTGRSGVLGKVFYVHDDFWPLNTSLWIKEFRHSMPAYAFHLLRGLDFGSFNAGSAVPTLNRNHVHTLPVLLPPMGLIVAFERVATTTLKRQRHNDDQSLTLAALRDTLLPKLISGELRIEDAKQIIERGTP